MQKQIVTKSLILSNYKKHRYLEVEFDEKENTVIGPNGEGKSTIKDARYWLWTGYDLERQFNHEVKPWITEERDKEDHVVVSVTEVFDFDGEEYKIRRELHEDWAPLSDEDPTEVYKGDTTKYFINDSPIKTKKEWESRLNAIYPISAFANVSNPDYFFNMKVEDMRKGIIDLVGGDVTVEDIIALNPEYEKLVNGILKTRTTEQYRKEINDNITANKKEYEAIPIRIKNNLNEIAKIEAETDFAQVEKDIEANQLKVKEIDEKIEEASNTDSAKKKIGLEGEVKALFSARDQFSKFFADDLARKNESLVREQKSLTSDIRAKSDSLLKLTSKVISLKGAVDRTEAQIKAKLEEWHKVNGSVFTPLEHFDEDHSPECDKCHRHFSKEEYALIESALKDDFNNKKKEAKELINKDGINLKVQLEEHNKEIVEAELLKTETQKEVQELQEKHDAIKLDESKVEDQTEWISFNEKIFAKQEELKAIEVDDSEKIIEGLNEEKAALQVSIDQLNRILGKRDAVKSLRNSIKEDEEKKTTVNKAILNWKKAKAMLDGYLKARASILETRVNKLFDHMKFTMFSFKNDGESVLDCIPTYQGTSYPSVNTGFRPIMFVDLANAYAKKTKINLPIFLDNMESVGANPVTDCQVINIEYPKYNKVKSLQVIKGAYQPQTELINE